MPVKYNYTYRIYNPKDNFILPDNKKYYDEVKYENCDYLNFFKNNWTEDKDENSFYTFSNRESKSIIKTYSTDMIRKISNKHILSKIINKKYYQPFTLSIFLVKDESTNLVKIIFDEKLFKKHAKKDSLWFLKKASDLTYGGYDVFPVKYDGDYKNFITILKEKINESNTIVKYRSNTFVLQSGIENPYLIKEKNFLYKFDIRAYGLIVKLIDIPFSTENIQFYFFKKFLTRRSIKKYDKNSLDKEVMLTNTTQAKIQNIDVTNLTTIGTDKSPFFDPMLNILKDLKKTILNNKQIEITEKYIVSIIGLDFIFDENLNPYLLEINKFPTLHCDAYKRKNYHHDLEDFMFSKDFFEITFKNLDRKYTVKNTKNWIYID